MFGKIFILCALIGISSCVDYCTLSCGAKHTMCKYKDALGAACVGYVNKPLTAAEKTYIVQLHNQARSDVAGGSLMAGGIPKASDMLQMSWDDELEQIAGRWAKQCLFQHDECRDSTRFPVGQNLAYVGTTGTMDRNAMLKKMFDGWFAENKDCPATAISSFPASSPKVIGHFTQAVWAKSSKVGCALTSTFDGTWNKYTLVCNYGPTGNYIGNKVFTSGNPATACPTGTTKSTSFPNLCA